MQLLATITTGGTENIPGKTLGMNSDQSRPLSEFVRIAFDDRRRFRTIEEVAIGVDIKFAEFRRETGDRFPRYRGFYPFAIADQIGDSDNR